MFWVEVIPVSAAKNPTGGAFIYRITALSQANARGTVSAWQSVWQPENISTPRQPVRLADMQTVLEVLP